MTRFEAPTRDFTCSADLEKDRRVTVQADGTIQYAAANELGIGVTLRAQTNGNVVAVRLFSAPGTWNFSAANATPIPLGDQIVAAANGQVESSGGTGSQLPFVNLGPATAAAGDLLEGARIG